MLWSGVQLPSMRLSTSHSIIGQGQASVRLAPPLLPYNKALIMPFCWMCWQESCLELLLCYQKDRKLLALPQQSVSYAQKAVGVSIRTPHGQMTIWKTDDSFYVFFFLKSCHICSIICNDLWKHRHVLGRTAGTPLPYRWRHWGPTR